jgi:hypothetical protein
MKINNTFITIMMTRYITSIEAFAPLPMLQILSSTKPQSLHSSSVSGDPNLSQVPQTTNVEALLSDIIVMLTEMKANDKALDTKIDTNTKALDD